MLAIEMAWQDNLKLPKEDQWESKQDIIENYCPNSCEIGLNLKEPTWCPEEYRKETCVECWNRKVSEVEKEYPNAESKFEQLRNCPVNTNIAINERNEETFIDAIKDNDIIVYIEENTDIYYDDIPNIIKWLQDVYDYATDIKSKVEYVDFNTAKEWMEQDVKNKARYGDYVYCIRDNELLCDDLYDACSLLLEAINSTNWILL